MASRPAHRASSAAPPVEEPPTPLLARQRQEFILERVAATGGVRVTDVVEALDVSEMTVRRDITELVNQGLVERVHGGAVASGPAGQEPRFTTKSELRPESKQRIGAAAAALVRPGDAVALSGGTTTLAVAHALSQLPHLGTLTIVTNSLPAGQVLFDAADAARAEGLSAPAVLLTGGELTPSNALVGPVAVDALAGMRVEWTFIGAHGLTLDAGLMTPNLTEAATNEALISAARTTVAVVDSSKWGILGLRTFCATSRIGALVTDAPPPQEASSHLEAAGISIVVAA
ncbi:MAG: DeoR/GlpR family DNA-binding transcription regulator [Actinomyces sp.]|uniref:DeoR/GlpR family DNA-binding transcription regulator n=1 Tax=Actinomyces sp. TaxID=29317 RepID=UPI0026DB746E|nr:DeoR/GlpR family DNA-binding transcription regulator [Actinomyces sp.]MDO4242391.1 DeoR/GlpR family DNA-binding transcription regulator [Actinomyces sp.]